MYGVLTERGLSLIITKSWFIIDTVSRYIFTDNPVLRVNTKIVILHAGLFLKISSNREMSFRLEEKFEKVPVG